jgi:hypothetical protein
LTIRKNGSLEKIKRKHVCLKPVYIYILILYSSRQVKTNATGLIQYMYYIMGQVQIGSLIRAIERPSEHVDDCFYLTSAWCWYIQIYMYTNIVQGVDIYNNMIWMISILYRRLVVPRRGINRGHRKAAATAAESEWFIKPRQIVEGPSAVVVAVKGSIPG